MKIVDRATFLALPPGTVYSKYEPFVFDDLAIKGDSIGDFDFYTQQIADALDADDSGELYDLLKAAQTEGVSVGMDFDCEGRDGLFDADQLFAVWERADVEALIARLARTLVPSPAPRVAS